MNQLRNQRTVKQYIKLGDYVEYWYKTYKQPKHEKSTIAVQLNYIRTHIKNSVLGNMNLTSVRTSDIQNFIKTLLKYGNKCKLKNLRTNGQGLASSTVKK